MAELLSKLALFRLKISSMIKKNCYVDVNRDFRQEEKEMHILDLHMAKVYGLHWNVFNIVIAV